MNKNMNYLNHELQFVQNHKEHAIIVREYACKICKCICWSYRDENDKIFYYQNNDYLIELNITCEEYIIKNIIE